MPFQQCLVWHVNVSIKLLYKKKGDGGLRASDVAGVRSGLIDLLGFIGCGAGKEKRQNSSENGVAFSQMRVEGRGCP